MTEALRAVTAAWVALVGAAVGSFLNVVIARLPAGESVVRPRSRCPHCLAPIAWYDNLPVVSWIALRGRCRRCRARISPRYLVVELLGAAAAFLAWQRHGLTASAAAEFVFVAFLLALAFIDVATWLLPHALTWPLVGAGLLASALGFSSAPSLASSALGAAVGFATFALVALVGKAIARREAMGFGDVWLLAGIGAWLGAAALLPVVLLASVQGSVVGLALIVLGKAQRGPSRGAAPAEGSDEIREPADAGAAGGVQADAGEAAGGKAEAAAGEADWVPPRNAVPFGPFLVAGALEWLYLAALLARLVPGLEAFR